jgi:8-oxo-dGTP diphosphatase
MPTPHQKTPNQIELIARALIVHQSHVLMCRSVKSGYLYLPGGHIEFSEPASEALNREMIEEAAQRIIVGPLLLTTENTFHDGNQDHHEINLVFHAELADPELFHVEQLTPGGNLPAIESQEPHIEFDWVDLAAVASLDIRPTQIRAWLASGGLVDAGPPAHIQGSAHLSCFEIDPPRAIPAD